MDRGELLHMDRGEHDIFLERLHRYRGDIAVKGRRDSDTDQLITWGLCQARAGVRAAAPGPRRCTMTRECSEAVPPVTRVFRSAADNAPPHL